jgi:hypothetical protein
MRDYNYIDEAGRLMPVAEMSSADIRECLDRGAVDITDDDGHGDTAVQDVLMRLRIELMRRGEA